MEETTQNEQVVRDLYREGANRRNISAFDRWVHPDLQFHGGHIGDYGYDTFRKNLTDFWAAFPDMTVTIEDLIADGDRVAVRLDVVATHQGEFAGVEATGRSVGFMDLLIFRFENGLIVEQWVLVDGAAIMAQITG